MTTFLEKISFDKFFKTALLILISYFLFLFTKIAKRTEKGDDFARFQLNIEEQLIFDTKTGESRIFNYPTK